MHATCGNVFKVFHSWFFDLFTNREVVGAGRAADTIGSSMYRFVSPLQPFQPTLPLLYTDAYNTP